MNNLTSAEQKLLNNMTRVRGSSMELGTKLQSIIGSLLDEGTPVNAVNAGKVLTVSGVAIDGDTITIINPAKSGVDVYEFLADVAQTKTAPSNIPIDITSYVAFATGTLTMDVQPTAGDTITIGSKTYTFVPVGTDTADGEVSVGADLAGAQAALVGAINGLDGLNTPHPLVSIGEFSSDDAVVTALIGGTAANSIATTETFTAVTNIFAAATLGSGTNCTKANAKTAIIAAITASDTQDVGATAGAGDDINLAADVAGADGNLITLAETMANGAFAGAATTLSGGVNGTISSGPKAYIDDTYLYVTKVANSVSGKNWRRISVGSAY